MKQKRTAYLLFLFLLPITLCFTLEREDTEGWKIFALKGNVKTLEKKEYEAIMVEGKIQKGKRKLQGYYDSDYRVQFSDKGLVLEEHHFNSVDQPYYYLHYWYDEKGKLFKDCYWEEGDTAWMYYYYDEQGRILREISYENDSTIEFETVFQYRNDSVYYEKTWKSGEGKGKKYTAKKDPQGREVEIYSYDKDGNPDYWWLKKYDTFGNLMESTSMQEGHISSYKTDYRMDPKGRVVEATSLYGFARETIRSYYDKYGHCIRQEKYNNTDQLVGETNYWFDSNHQLVKREAKVKNEVLELVAWKYEYDQKGNWVSCIFFNDQQPVRIIERKIVYYE